MEDWLTDHFIEIFGALTGILYVLLEIRQNILLWPLGIITSAVYIYVFRENGFYAGMVLQFYYVAISVYGWWAWSREHRDRRRGHGARSREHGVGERALRNDPVNHFSEQTESAEASEDQQKDFIVRTIDFKTGVICAAVAIVLWGGLWYMLDRWTDSPVPLWDGLITSMSVVATWMLTRKILEQWHVWIIANVIATVVYLAVGMYPTAILFMVYAVMAVAGLREWKKSRGGKIKYETL